MKIHRFIGDFDLSKETISIKDKEFLNQVLSVLRMKKGENLILCDGKLNEVVGEITETEKDSIKIKVSKRQKNNNEPTISCALYCAVLKKENFEWVVQKATELGVREIIPIITDRTIKTNLNKSRLEKITKEASEQSGRGMVPKIHDPIKFSDAIKNIKNDLNIFFDISGANLILKGTQSEKTSKINVFVGPEGGWSERELEIAKENNFIISKLGGLTLRAETASIISTYLVLNKISL